MKVLILLRTSILYTTSFPTSLVPLRCALLPRWASAITFLERRQQNDRSSERAKDLVGKTKQILYLVLVFFVPYHYTASVANGYFVNLYDC